MTEKLIKGLEKLNLSLSENQIQQLEGYIQEVLEFNTCTRATPWACFPRTRMHPAWW